MGFAIGLLVVGCVGLCIGWHCGRLYTRDKMAMLARAQQDRGDYWFEQYREATKQRSGKR